MQFTEQVVVMPNHDSDVILKFPGGKKVVIQARPSNADVNYNGSLDIILPKNQVVTAWKGDDMKDAPAINKDRQHIRRAKQLVTDLPGVYE